LSPFSVYWPLLSERTYPNNFRITQFWQKPNFDMCFQEFLKKKSMRIFGAFLRKLKKTSLFFKLKHKIIIPKILLKHLITFNNFFCFLVLNCFFRIRNFFVFLKYIYLMFFKSYFLRFGSKIDILETYRNILSLFSLLKSFIFYDKICQIVHE